MRYLITGGCGFLGSNLANEALRRGEEVFILDNLCRTGSHKNQEWLRTRGDFKFYQADIRNYHDVEKVFMDCKPEFIFHLAGQVAMTTSIDDPRKDFETNVIGTHNVLEVVRKFSVETPILYSSTNKVYGDLEEFEYEETPLRYIAKGYETGFDERVRLDFRSPYGCSKGAADQYMLDYARVFGLNTVVFRHSSIFGGRQFSTYDQGWIGWFVHQALLQSQKKITQPFSISGNGKQVRDVLFSSDLVNCYFSAVDHISSARGQAFNIGGGHENSLSLLELFQFLERELNITLQYKQLDWRQSDQKVFIADIRKAAQLLNWKPLVTSNEGLQKMIEWVRLIPTAAQ